MSHLVSSSGANQTISGSVGITNEVISTITSTVITGIGTSETTITVTTVKAVKIIPTAGDGGTYYWSHTTGSAKTSSNGDLLDSSHPIILSADKGEQLTLTFSISRSTGTGSLIVHEYDAP